MGPEVVKRQSSPDAAEGRPSSVMVSPRGLSSLRLRRRLAAPNTLKLPSVGREAMVVANARRGATLARTRLRQDRLHTRRPAPPACEQALALRRCRWAAALCLSSRTDRPRGRVEPVHAQARGRTQPDWRTGTAARRAIARTTHTAPRTPSAGAGSGSTRPGLRRCTRILAEERPGPPGPASDAACLPRRRAYAGRAAAAL
jgi:hypothetical protein